jgi:hypothetical protein
MSFNCRLLLCILMASTAVMNHPANDYPALPVNPTTAERGPAMQKLMLLLTTVLLACWIVPPGAALAQTTADTLIWRPRISPTDVPKAATPPPSCDDNSIETTSCVQSPLDTTKPIDLRPSYVYKLTLPYDCSDGVIKADVTWQGATVPQLSIGGTSYPLGSGNQAEIQANFSNGSVPTVVLKNPGSRMMRISRFGATMGCNVRSSVTRVWVDDNVRENDLKGMRIHVAFSVQNQKGMDSTVVAYFSNQNGDKLFRSSGKQLAVRRTFRPTYGGSSYADVALFMPYRDIPGSRGANALRFRIRLTDDASGGFFGRSEYVNFTLTR